MGYSPFFVFVGLFATSALAITEYVAFAPAGLQVGPSISNPILKWAELRYSVDASTVAEVYFDFMNATSPEVGKWYDLDLSKGGGKGAGLTCKVHGDKLYAYVQKEPTQDAQGGCCADTLRIYDRTTGEFTELDIDSILSKIFPQTVSFHHATHTFDIEEEDGVVYAFLMVQFTDPNIDDALCNAAVVISTVDGTVKKTKDGDAYFSFSQHIGTLSTVFNESIFKVQYITKKQEEWHGNGMLRFTTKNGLKLLAITHRMDSEAVIIKDPYTYGGSDGGGSILQRFGTPKSFTSSSGTSGPYHFFGIPANSPEWSGGCHNVFYTAATNTKALMGAETISLFVNSVTDATTSFVFEFVLKLTEQKPDVVYDDTVFVTKYVSSACGFEAMAQGGTRAFGNGLFLVASGSIRGKDGLMEIVDSQGEKKDLSYPTSANPGGASFYDPFIYVTKSTQEIETI